MAKEQEQSLSDRIREVSKLYAQGTKDLEQMEKELEAFYQEWKARIKALRERLVG